MTEIVHSVVLRVAVREDFITYDDDQRPRRKREFPFWHLNRIHDFQLVEHWTPGWKPESNLKEWGKWFTEELNAGRIFVVGVANNKISGPENPKVLSNSFENKHGSGNLFSTTQNTKK
jgi:hypothetical protein